MSTIVTRAGKGTPLTNAEVDANFINLNTGKLELSGGTLTGFLTLHAAPTSSLHAASKGYVDGVIPAQTGNSGKFLTTDGTALSWGTVDLTPYLAKSGGAMTGAITFAAGQTWPTFNQNTTGTAAGLSATLAIANGGTGATTAAGALTNLGAYAASNPSGFTTNLGTVTSITAGTGLSGGAITTSGTIALANTTVTAGSYTTANITVDAQGRITAAANGSGGGSFLPLAGGTMTGLLIGKNGTTADINSANDTGSFSCRGDASFPASMSFHRTGVFAINCGLSTANNFVIGGWSASSNAFSMSSGGTLTMLGNVTASSDETLKTNWRGYALDFVEQLAKVKHGTYDRIDQELTQDGVSAQKLQPLLPNSVITGEDGKLAVNYGGAAMVSAIQLAKRLVALEATVAKLVD